MSEETSATIRLRGMEIVQRTDGTLEARHDKMRATMPIDAGQLERWLLRAFREALAPAEAHNA